jgi:hypothetical protein
MSRYRIPGLIFLLVIGAIMLLFAGWTEGNMEWLLGKLANRPVDVPYWLAFLLTFLTNMFGIVFNLICEVCKIVWP